MRCEFFSSPHRLCQPRTSLAKRVRWTCGQNHYPSHTRQALSPSGVRRIRNPGRYFVPPFFYRDVLPLATGKVKQNVGGGAKIPKKKWDISCLSPSLPLPRPSELRGEVVGRLSRELGRKNTRKLMNICLDKNGTICY